MAGSARHEVVYSRAWRERFGRVCSSTTRGEVAFLRRVLPRDEFPRILDVPCGYGRHMAPLVDAGYEVVGVDSDAAVVAEAAAGGLDARVGDMRDLGPVGEFDAVVNLWASFGFFDDETNAAVLRGFASRARRVVLDVYDPAFFAARAGVRAGGGVVDRKWVEDGRLHTELDYGAGVEDRLSWRLYAPAELAALGDLELTLACSGFDETTPARGEVPRMQVVLDRVT